MKKDKLYTINRWNANIFWPGGDMDKGITNFSGGNAGNNTTGFLGSMINNPTMQPVKPEVVTPVAPNMSSTGNYGYSINNGGVGTAAVYPYNIKGPATQNVGILPTNVIDAANTAFQKVITNKDKPATVDNVQGGAPSFMDKYGGLIGTGISMVADNVPTSDKYKRGLWDAADPVYHLAGGKESGVGNALSDVGVGLTKAGLSTGNYGLAAAGAGAKIVGGLWNGAFGFDWNDGLINSIKDNTNKMNYAGSAFGQAKTSSDFFSAAGLMGNSRTFNNSDIGSSGWLRSNRKINNKANALRAQQSAAEAFQGGNMVQSARKIDKRMDDIARRNQFAYGGLMGNTSGSLGLMQQNAALSALQQQQPLFKKGIYGSMFADGGYKPTTFMDSFSADPIGTIVNYRNQLDQQALAEQQAEAEALRAEEYAALQDRLSAIESQNQGLQAQLAAMPTTPLTVPEELMSTPIEATPVDVSSLATPVSPSYYSQALAGTRGKNKTWDYVEDQLRKSGKFNDIQLLGIKSNLERESGMQYNVIGDNGAAYGLGQWHGSRQPKDKSLAGQTNLLLNSLSTFDRNHWIGKENFDGFMNARTPEEAHYYLAAGYERPKKSIIAKLKKESDESLKNLKAMGGNLFADGGNIEIKHPGRLTELKERTGKTEAELWAEGKPDVRKMITFNTFAKGGKMQNHGADWTNGLTVIDTGDSHEANPLGGVQMGVDNQGVPNLVEEGETVYNDYVFSDRLTIPEFMYKELGLKQSKSKKEISFADASKEIAKESQQRPNDPISKNGLQASMAKLAQVQETLKAAHEAEQEQNTFACGGRLANKYDGVTQPSQQMTTNKSSRHNYNTYTVPTETPVLLPAVTPAPATPNPVFGILGTSTTPFSFGNPYSLEDAINKDIYKPNLEVKPFDIPREPGEPWKYEDNREQVNPPLYQTWMRYVPALGAGIASITDALGWTNKPDYTYVDKLEAMANRAGYVPNIDYKPVGQYRRYNPMDIWYAKNFNDAQARATGRAITNNAAPVGTKAAAQLANSYVNQMSTAELYNKALAYNDALQNAVATFNRGTDMFNSQQDLAASEANAKYRQMAYNYGLSGLAQAAAMRNAIDQRIGAARSANLTNLLTSLGNIGRENFAMNQINSDRSRHYYGTLSGTSGYKRDTKKKEG